ncbi:MAG: flippase-like domain-containing protein [Candidatus Sumerlaeota bacterium]|nr:flippase-like domain-containing protein [Candidatus Sumerlaeota bacterium]
MKSPRLPHLRILVAGVLLLICLPYVIFSFRWREIGGVLRQMDWPLFLITSGGTIIAYWLLRAWRWQILLRQTGIHARFKEVFYLTVVALSLSNITPFQSGEAIKVEWLKSRHNVRRSQGYATFLVERLLDLAAVLLFALAGVLDEFHALFSLRRIAFFALVLLIALGIIWKWTPRQFLTKRFKAFHDSVRDCLRDPFPLSMVIALTLAGWIMVVAGWHVSLNALFLKIGFIQTLELTGVTTLINILSFVPGAVGVSEVGTAYLLKSLGQPDITAQAGAIALRVYGLWLLMLGFVIYFLCLLLRWRLRIGLMPRTKVNYSFTDMLGACMITNRNSSQKEELRKELSHMLGQTNILLTPSGRGALYYLLRSLAMKKVLIPAYTCKAVEEACRLAGKKIVFGEVEEEGFNMPASEVERFADADTAVIATHQFGFPCDIKAITDICAQRRAFLIEDVAPALGTRVGGRLAGQFGDAAFYSFDSTKMVNVPLKGGCLTVKDNALFRRVEADYEAGIQPIPFATRIKWTVMGMMLLFIENPLLYRLFHWLEFEARGRFTNDGPELRLTPSEFYRYEMAQWQAFLARKQIRRFSVIIAHRRSLYRAYHRHLKGLNAFLLPPEDEKSEWGCIRFPIRVKGDKLAYYRRATRLGVDFAFSFTYIVCPDSCARAKSLAQSVLDLPFYLKMTEKDIIQVASILKELETERHDVENKWSEGDDPKSP